MGQKTLHKYAWAGPTRTFFSLKTGGKHWCESVQERNYLLTLEFDDRVRAYRVQPFSLQDVHETIRRYTPDVEVVEDKAPYLVEVKPDWKVNAPLLEKLGLINDYLFRRRLPRLKLVKSSEFDVGERIRNLSLLYGYRRAAINTPEIRALLATAPDVLSLDELRALIARQGAFPPSLPFSLIAHGVFRFDVTTRLTGETILARRP